MTTAKTSVAVCGMGCVLPDDLAARIPLAKTQDQIAAYLAQRFPAQSFRRIPRQTRWALAAACDALTHAQVPVENLGLVLGTAFACASMGMDFLDSFVHKGPQYASPTAFSHSVTNICAGLLSQILGIHGPVFTVSQGSLSFAGALSTAQALLAAGRVSHVLVGAVEERDERISRACCAVGVPYPVVDAALFFCLSLPELSPQSPRLAISFGEVKDTGAPEADPLRQARVLAELLAKRAVPAYVHAQDPNGGSATLTVWVEPCN